MQETYDLKRFITAQEPVYQDALGELSRGLKKTHWMWFIFPQIEGLGSSEMAMRYAIRSLDEAKSYISHPVLGPRLLKCCSVLMKIHGKNALEILGSPDDLKLRSSMTLFSLASAEIEIFPTILQKYFDGEHFVRTREILTLSGCF